MTDVRLHNRVRRRRKAEGLSQQALAESLGVSRQAIHAIETGSQVPSTSLGLRMARVFGCAVEDLFSLAADPGIRARVAPAAPGSETSSRVALGQVEGRWVAHRIPAHGMSAADGIIAREAAGAGAEVALLADAGRLSRNVLVAGCAPLLGAVAQRVGSRFSDARLTWLRAGNGRALGLLAERLVHMAGLHLPGVPGAGGDDDTACAARRALPDRRLLVVNLTRWRQGLVVPAGNPRGLTGGADLLDSGLRVVRREEGSGAQALAAAWLTEAKGDCGLSATGPLARGHAEVARLVRWGAADVGIAIESAALAEGLDFVPITEERFDLVVPEALAATPPVSRVIDALDDPGFRTDVSHLPGYDGSLSGQVTTVNAA